MSEYKGKKISVEIFGTSRGEKISAVICGLDGFSFDMAKLREFLKRRSPSDGEYSTSRKEPDVPVFVDGVEFVQDGNASEEGKIVGKIHCEIANKDIKNTKNKDFYGIPRPSHADLVRYYKDGELDFSGGGEYSARLTAMYALAGGICKQILKNDFGVDVFAYLTETGGVIGKGYYDGAKIDREFKSGEFPALGNSEKMLEKIAETKADGDSLGGEVECVIKNLPAGLGGAMFRGLEGKIAAIIYAIPAVKAVEFGLGSKLKAMKGSEANDGIYYDEKGKICFSSNYSGGINGGVSNGDDIVFRAAFRPAPTISKPQNTVDLVNKTNVTASFGGRNDSCPAVRAVAVVEAVAAIAILDELL